MTTDKKNTVIGIQLKHYHSAFDGFTNHQMTQNFGDSITDTSTYKPDISLVRAYLGSSGSSGKKFLYDYPAGTPDDGQVIRTVLRSPGLDITEVDTAERVMTQIIEDKKKSDKLSSDQKKAQQDIIDAINSAKDSFAGKPSSDNPDTSNTSQQSTK